MMAGPQSDPKRLRQIAILMSCLDAAAQQQLMMHMPTDVVRKVRHLVRNLGSVSEEEKQQVLKAFQQTVRAPTSGFPAVSPAESSSIGHGSTPDGTDRPEPSRRSGGDLSNRAEADADRLPTDERPPDAPDPNAPPWTRMEVDELVRFVQAERPTVIAVVVHQLPIKKAVDVLARLDPGLSSQVVRVLAHMEEVDPEAKAAIDGYLRERLGRQLEQRASRSRVQQRIEALLGGAPEHLRAVWAAALQQDAFTREIVGGHRAAAEPRAAASKRESAMPVAGRDPTTPANELAARRGDGAPSGGPIPNDASQPVQGASGPRRSEGESPSDSSPAKKLPTGHGEPRADAGEALTAATEDILPFAPAQRPDPARDVDYTLWMMEFERLLDLPPTSLAAVLTEAGTETVLLALAGASPEFMRRFQRMLDRRDVRRLERELVELGPLNLEDIDRAQRRLLQLAERRSGGTVPIRRAA